MLIISERASLQFIREKSARLKELTLKFNAFSEELQAIAGSKGLKSFECLRFDAICLAGEDFYLGENDLFVFIPPRILRA